MREGFISAQVSERSETSAEITHLARETVPYAFSRTISDVLCEMGISRTWCQSGEFVLECEKTVVRAPTMADFVVEKYDGGVQNLYQNIS